MTDNELIAKFMGYVFHKEVDIDNSECGGLYERTSVWSKHEIKTNDYPEDDQYYLVESSLKEAIIGHLTYHTSWDSLMPVVEKIYEWGKEKHNGAYLIDDWRHLSDLTIFANIEVVYRRTVEFIKWYNQQKYLFHNE